MEFAVDLNTIINGGLLIALTWVLKTVRNLEITTRVNDVRLNHLENALGESCENRPHFLRKQAL